MHALREFAGFLIAPLVPGVLLSSYALIRQEWDGALGIIGVSAFLAYPFAVIVGAPLYLLFEQRRWRAWLHYAAGGAFVGTLLYVAAPIVVVLIMSLNGQRGGSLTLDLFLLPIMIVCAVIATIMFWLIVRPDRHEPISP